MLSYYFSFLLYVCVDICYDFHKVPYREAIKSDLSPERNIVEKNSSNLCGFCDLKWKESSIANASNYTKFLFYSRKTGTNYSEIFIGNVTSLDEAGFDRNKSTKVLVHGWIDNGLIHFGALMREAYLEAYDTNVIVLDWSEMAYLFYPLSRIAVDPVGRYLAVLVDWLVAEVGVAPPSLHVVGHSLGAHIAGVAGEHVTTGALYRISGLDPAGPGFDWQKNGRLDASDARFVDIIHTSGGWAGYFSPCGHVDFYPNGGIPNQPGCPIDWGRCSHIRSYQLFAESVVSGGFVAQACGDWWSYKRDKCDNQSETHMGEHVDLSARGKYYLKTAGQYPYSLS